MCESDSRLRGEVSQTSVPTQLKAIMLYGAGSAARSPPCPASHFKQPRRADTASRSRRMRASFTGTCCPSGIQRAQGMPGARCARSLACKIKSTRVSHHGHTGFTRHSPRNGFNGFLRALPGDRAFLSPSLAELASANLTPASRRQDHTTSPSASPRPRQKHSPRPPHPASRP
jgi:hypothetical protein